MTAGASPEAAGTPLAAGMEDFLVVEVETGWAAYPEHKSAGPKSVALALSWSLSWVVHWAVSWARPSSCNYREVQTPRRCSLGLRMASRNQPGYGLFFLPSFGPAISSSHRVQRVEDVGEARSPADLLSSSQGWAASELRLRG